MFPDGNFPTVGAIHFRCAEVASSSSRFHDRELPDGVLITAGVKRFWCASGPRKFQRGRLWLSLRPVRVGQDRAIVLLAFLMICAVRYDTIRDDMIYGTCSLLCDI